MLANNRDVDALFLVPDDGEKRSLGIELQGVAEGAH
jgi:hypothetical protein